MLILSSEPRVLSYQLKLTAVRLKKGTAQSFELANLTRILINWSWYDITYSAP